MEQVRSHYQRLGVTPAATTTEIRAAYRALAAQFHPDRVGDEDPKALAFAERRMREINESWRVLSDPARRLAYDQTRRTRPKSTPPASSPLPKTPNGGTEDDLVDVFPEAGGLQSGLFRHLPWVAMLVVLGLIFVVSAYASTDKAPTADPKPGVGTCLDVSPGPSTTIVGCESPHEFQVVARVPDLTQCPPGTEGRRLANDNQFDCLVRASK